jgi:nitrate reductase molybdenum cofactor assembly chaperone
MSDRTDVLRDLYSAMAHLWCSPQDADRQEVIQGAGELAREWQRLDGGGAALLSQFLESPVSEDEYVELFELAPLCSLYLGSHSYDEPKSCAGAAVSDRNGYMIDLLGIYRHLGCTPTAGELPDYLPLMVEFLSLSAGREDPIREKLIQEYILPYLPLMRSRLEELKTPYLNLLDALERVMRLDLQASEVSHA